MKIKQAIGPFEVKLQPQSLSDIAGQTGLGRMSLDKHFHGDLEATSRGEMLAFRSSVPGSAGYVAMEPATLPGRSSRLQARKGKWPIGLTQIKPAPEPPR